MAELSPALISELKKSSLILRKDEKIRRYDKQAVKPLSESDIHVLLSMDAILVYLKFLELPLSEF